MIDGVDMSEEGEGVMVDLAGVEEAGGFEALPKGMYDCVIDDCTFEFSQNSGNPMWTLVLEVEGGEYAGRKLFSHMVFKGEGLRFTKKQLNRVAPELVAGGAFDPADQNVIDNHMLGKKVRARVTVRKFDGEDRNNVRDIFEGGESDSFTG